MKEGKGIRPRERTQQCEMEEGQEGGRKLYFLMKKKGRLNASFQKDEVGGIGILDVCGVQSN